MNRITLKDTIKPPVIGGIKMPKIKGRVDVQLFNAETGALEAEAHGENMATNALQKIFSDNFFGLINYLELMPIKDILLGGVLCFRDPLNANADNIYAPTTNTNPVIAHAGQNTYSAAGDDITRGNPNNIESGTVQNGYKYVWDFASTQGNGQISALSLTSKDAGDYWLNNGSNLQPLQFFDRLDVDGQAYSNDNTPPLFFDNTNNCAYALFGSNTSLTVRKFYNYSPLNQASMNETFVSIQGIIEASANVYEDHNYTLASNIYNARYLFDETDQEIHCLFFGNGTITRHIIDLSDNSISRSDLTVTGANMTSSYSNTYAVCQPTYLDDDGYLYAPKSNSTTMYKIKYTNPSDVTELSGSASLNAQGNILTFGKMAFDVFGGVIADATRVIQARKPDLITNVWNQHPVSKPINGLNAFSHYIINSKYHMPYCAFWKLYLATIFNLDNPITKTSTQTMKITYTVTEVIT